jgi:hypothetical protein
MGAGDTIVSIEGSDDERAMQTTLMIEGARRSMSR